MMVKWVSLAGLVYVLDQASKFYVVNVLDYLDRVQVLPFFAWVRWHNEGAAFSFLAQQGGWQHYFFVCLAIGFSVFILYEMWRLPATERVMGWVYGLILGGAVGNLTDRLVHGHVIDFILFHYEEHIFPAFNIADSALFCGAAVWICLMIYEHRQARQNGGGDVTDNR